MRKHTSKEILSPDACRRVIIFQRTDGLFSFQEERRTGDSWSPLWSNIPLCNTEEAAERRATAEISWLQELKRPRSARSGLASGQESHTGAGEEHGRQAMEGMGLDGVSGTA